MPFFRASEKLIYFAHVPKCAGSTVEHYLRKRFGALGFVDEHFYSLPRSLHWSRSSAQHVPVSILERLFPPGIFDASFTVVRNPVERIVSEFHYLRDLLQRIDPSESFSSWVVQIDGVLATSPWLYDNHLRPMTEMVPDGATVFRLEDGLDRIIPYLDDLVGRHGQELTFDRVLTRDPSIPRVVPTPDDIAEIERLYRQDFDRFGYPMMSGAVAATVLPAPVLPKPVAVAHPDRSALAVRFRDLGLGFFRDGNIAEAYANFRFALNCAPDDAQVHGMIASAALRLGAVHLAMDHAAKALARQPRNLDALLALAGARLKLKHPDARESVEALASFAQLGDFPALMRMALEAAEGNYEAALVDVAGYLETRPLDGPARELFSETVRAFRESPDKERFQQFVDGVGVLAEPGVTDPLVKPAIGQKACVDVIIPVNDALADVRNCLASLRQWSSSALHKVILVDYGSAPETAGWLAAYRDRHNDVELVRITENVGPTGAMMAGVGQSRAPYMLFLNSDTEVTSDWLDGMLEAMRAEPRTALVGPLSNKALYESIQPAKEKGTSGPWNRSPDDFAALVKSLSKRAFPRVPFLSGFCLLVHREAFDSAGGLDSEAFPRGVWQIQDLCLKITDLGYDSVIADHVYVHRAGGDTSSDLDRDRMFERHSALRVLIAEAISAMQPDVAGYTASFEALNRFLASCITNESSKTVRPPFGPPVQRKCLKAAPDSMVERELCLFVTHCPLGAPHEYTMAYLAELKRAGLLVIVCLVVEDLDVPVTTALLDLADGVLLRENGGYDFGAWADLLRHVPQAWGAGRLYFANDSILGPFRPLGPIIDKIRDHDAGFFALTECTILRQHPQSYFFGWNQTNLTSDTLRHFWENVQNLVRKDDVILRYEIGLSQLHDGLRDPVRQIVFSFPQTFGCSPDELLGFSPTRNGWKRMLSVGFPFIKTDVLRDGVATMDTSDWERVCAFHGADPDAIHRCIEASRINRLNIGKVVDEAQPVKLGE